MCPFCLQISIQTDTSGVCFNRQVNVAFLLGLHSVGDEEMSETITEYFAGLPLQVFETSKLCSPESKFL